MLSKGKQTMSFLQDSTSLPKFPKRTPPVPQQRVRPCWVHLPDRCGLGSVGWSRSHPESPTCLGTGPPVSSLFSLFLCLRNEIIKQVHAPGGFVFWALARMERCKACLDRSVPRISEQRGRRTPLTWGAGGQRGEPGPNALASRADPRYFRAWFDSSG